MKCLAALASALLLPSISLAIPIDIDALPTGSWFPDSPLAIATPLGDVYFVGEIRASLRLERPGMCLTF